MNNIDKLKKLIAQADDLLNCQDRIDSDDVDLRHWQNSVKRFLMNTYGKNSAEINLFNEIPFKPTSCPEFLESKPHNPFSSQTSNKIRAEARKIHESRECRERIKLAKKNLQAYLEELEENQNSVNENKDNINMDLTKVFIVHGHNGEMKHHVARIVEQQGLEAIILDEQTNNGCKTIIEKLEQHSNVSAAICLFTADDIGKANKETNYHKRARENVVFETGLFIGKLGRNRIVIIREKEVDLLSDLQGVVYLNENWKFDMLKELKNMGFNIDMNKLF